MGNDINCQELSIQPQQSIFEQRFDNVSQQSYDFPMQKKQKNIKADKNKTQILQTQKYQEHEKSRKAITSIGFNNVKPCKSAIEEQKNEGMSLRTTFGGKEQQKIFHITKSDPTGVKNPVYKFVQLHPQINIRDVQIRIIDQNKYIPQSISGIGSSQSPKQVRQTLLSGQRFVEHVLKKNLNIDVSQRKFQDIAILHRSPIKKQQKKKKLQTLLIKNEEELEPQKIQEDKLQQKCLGVCGINFNQVPKIFQNLFQDKSNMLQNHS